MLEQSELGAVNTHSLWGYLVAVCLWIPGLDLIVSALCWVDMAFLRIPDADSLAETLSKELGHAATYWSFPHLIPCLESIN